MPEEFHFNFNVGDEVIIQENWSVYDTIYPNAGMSRYFGIGRWQFIAGQKGIITQKSSVEQYVGKRYCSYVVSDIEYIFPPWLIVKANQIPSWEV